MVVRYKGILFYLRTRIHRIVNLLRFLIKQFCWFFLCKIHLIFGVLRLDDHFQNLRFEFDASFFLYVTTAVAIRRALLEISDGLFSIFKILIWIFFRRLVYVYETSSACCLINDFYLVFARFHFDFFILLTLAFARILFLVGLASGGGPLYLSLYI